MKLPINFILLVWLAPHLSLQQQANKTKRTAPDIGNYGDPGSLWYYSDNLKPQVTQRNPENVFGTSKPLAIVELQPVKIVEPSKELPQSTIYDIHQRDTTNLVPSVKQLLSGDFNLNTEFNQFKAPSISNTNSGILTSETIVSPVQHNQVIRNHNHQFSAPRAHPLYNAQPTYQIPNKKYAYVNGKIIYDPTAFQFHQSSQQLPLQTGPNLFNTAPQSFHPHLNKQQLINFHNYHTRHVPRPNLTPPAVQSNPVKLPTITKFQPPKPQIIDTPSHPPANIEKPQRIPKKETKEPERPINEEEREESEDEPDENSSYQNDDDEEYEPYEEDSPQSGKYSSFDDDDEEHSSYRDHEDDSEEENDNNEGSSKNRYVTTKVKKYPKKKYRQEEKSEVYYIGKYEYPDKTSPKKNGKKHKMQYKGYKYHKNTDEPDAGSSQNVPVIHKQKVLKEKWIVSKSSSDRKKFNE